MTTESISFDAPWKEILEQYLQDFMAFFFPQINAAIDWDRGYTFLDKELQQIVREAEIGRRLVDKLVQVWRLDGVVSSVCHVTSISANASATACSNGSRAPRSQAARSVTSLSRV